MKRDLETAFLYYWQILTDEPEPEREYRIAREVVGNAPGIRQRLAAKGIKDWRFDFAWVKSKIAVETEGGTWVHGAHVRGKHFRSDCEKYNFAQSLGWKVFRFTGDMIDDDPAGCIEMVLEAILKINL